MVKRDIVTMIVDRGFFDDVFEPSRKKLEKQLGARVTQKSFTQMLKKNKVNLNINLKGFNKNVKKKNRK